MEELIHANMLNNLIIHIICKYWRNGAKLQPTSVFPLYLNYLHVYSFWSHTLILCKPIKWLSLADSICWIMPTQCNINPPNKLCQTANCWLCIISIVIYKKAKSSSAILNKPIKNLELLKWNVTVLDNENDSEKLEWLYFSLK